MKTKKQNGFVIELMIVFMLVTFGFCMLVTTFMSTLVTERKLANKEFKRQMTLNQIGEYYLRCVEAGGVFPDKYENITKPEKYKDFAWMDENEDKKLDSEDNTVKFFEENKHYIYQDKIYVNYGDLWDFFEAQGVKRRLTVTSNSKTKMILTVDEKYQNSKDSPSNCEILTWYTGDDLSDPTDSDDFKTTQLTTLQKLWKFFGLTSSDLKNMERNNGNIWLLNKLKDIYNGINIIGNDWKAIFD